MTGEGPSYIARQRERVRCPKFSAELVSGSLAAHRQTQSGFGRGPQWADTLPPVDQHMYRVFFPRTTGLVACPVEDCRGGTTSRANLLINFVHRHAQDMIMIMEEGNQPRPCCPDCNMFVPWVVINRRHPTTTLCVRGAEQKHQRLAEEESRERSSIAFRAYGQPLAMVTSFRYLGRTLTAMGDDWTGVVGNLWKERRTWARLSRVLGREGADSWT